MNNEKRFLLNPVSAAAVLSLTLVYVVDASAQTAPSSSGAPSGSAPAGIAGAPSESAATPTGGYGSGALSSGTLGGPSDPSPYYIGVSQAFTHDSNVYRVPDGRADTYSSTSLLGGFDQPLGRQRVFGRAYVTDNRYRDQTTLDNVSYSINTGIDLETVENLSGRLSGTFNQSLASAPSTAGTPTATRNISNTETIEALIRWGGPSLLSIEGSANYSNVGYSAVEYQQSEFNHSGASLNLFYHGGGPLRVGMGIRGDVTHTPQAFVDPATGQVQSTRLTGTYFDLLADYEVTGQIGANGRLSYTRQDSSGGGDVVFSGWTGNIGLSWQVTGKTSLHVDAARDAGFNATTYNTFAFTQTANGIALTPVVAVYQNNQLTTSAGVSASYAATAKIAAFASARYQRAEHLNVFTAPGTPAPDVIDISKILALGASYQITRSWGAGCNMSYEQRDVSGGTNFSYDAKAISCSTQFTWR